MIFLELFWTFFKIGLFTFGGGYAMLPLIESEVIGHEWATTEEIVDFIAISESTPGPFAINISTFIGRTVAGIPGSLCSTFGVVLPSFIVILIVSKFFAKFRESNAVKGAMTGLRPTVVGLIASALLSVGQNVFVPANGFAESFESVRNTLPFIISAALFAACVVLAFKKKHPILIICLSATVGIVTGYALGL
jgi:chromate transporter